MKNNLIRFIIIGLVVSAICLTGCETLSKKFTRPPKKGEKPAIVIVEENRTQGYPNSILYQSHYVLWKSWQDELINSLGGNHKKEIECARAVLSELQSMRKLLNAEGQAAIDPLVLELENLVVRVEKGNLSFASLKQLRNNLNQHKARVVKRFHYHKISNWIKPDQSDNVE